MKRRIASIILAAAMAASAFTAFAADTVTRAEWIGKLVETFSMTVEDDSNMPDNYFSDITSEDEYYRNILVAVEFGVIDLEAGEAFEPNEPATREFAARTLNSCLQFQLDEGTEYTYDESGEVTYPDDIQIAVNRGWFELSGGKFLPEQAITEAEETVMLADAANVLADDTIDEGYDSAYEFAEGVIVVPETASVTVDSDYTVTISDYDDTINEGDVFVVYQNNYPLILKALSVENGTDAMVITSTTEDTEEYITDVDSEGVIGIDLENFEFNELTTYSITNTETNEDEDMTLQLQSIDYNPDTKVLTASQKISIGDAAAGSLSIKMSNMQLSHKENKANRQYEAIITADTNVTTAISFDLGKYAGIPSSITLGEASIGVASVTLSMDYSITGGVSMSWDGTLKAGYSLNNGNFRLIKSYTKKSFTFTAEAEIKAGLRLHADVNLLLAKGNIYATVGVNMSFKLSSYDSGTPKTCVTIKGYLYASIGASASVLGESVYNDSKTIFNESNSPVRAVYHYEDDKLVSSCSRGENLKYTTSYNSKYFNPSQSYGQGSYGGDDNADPVVIWEYSTDDDGNATITKYNGTASAVAIPSEIDGYTVTKIGSSAFKNNTTLRAVTMANTIVEIGVDAFSGCKNLSSVILSNKLQTLGHQAFENCTSLTEIEIPKSLNDVTSYYGTQCGVFNNSGLKEATFEEGTTKVVNNLFREAYSLENVTLLDTMTSIDSDAFNSCTSLKSITIPEAVTTINSGAFSGCTSLTTINFSDSVTTINSYAFNNCESLTNVKLPKYLETLGYHSFDGCTSVTEIEIPKSLDTVTSYYDTQRGVFMNSGLKKVTFEEGTTKVVGSLFEDASTVENVTLLDTMLSINSHAFSGCTALKNIEIPDSITTIGDNAFSGCKNLGNVTLPKYLDTLGYDAFYGCKSLTEIEIPKSLKTVTSYWDLGREGVFTDSGLKTVTFENGTTAIPDRLLRCAYNLENVTLPNSLTYIGWKAFENCTSLKEISIPDSVTGMGTYIFSGCTSLEKAKLPSIRQNVTEGTFYNCKSLTDISLPNTVIAIRANAFSGCTSLEKLTLPEKVQTIESSAFYNCTSLSNINIPDSVTSVGSSAFENCDALTKIETNMSGSIGSSAFKDCDALTTLKLGDGVTSIGSSMCYDCDSLTDVTLGKYITTIPDSAFRLCQSLTSITLPRFCTTVASNAFAEDTKLTDAYVPVAVSSIESNSFSYPAKMTMHGKSGSYAEEYADSRNMTFEAESAPITSIAYADKSMGMSAWTKVRPTLNIAPAFDTSTVTFASSDESILTVSDTGEVYGKNYGTATITASSDSGKSTSIEITVLKTASSLTLSETAVKMIKGDSKALTVTMNPTDAADKLVWSSSNESAATVDQSGKITAVGKGTAVISVKASYSGVSADCTVTVSNSTADVDGVKLDRKSCEMVIGSSAKLKATVSPTNAVNPAVTWTTSDSSVATVDNGIVTAVSVGTATITVTTADGGYTASCVITVIPKPEITDFTVAGKTATLTANDVPASAAVYIAAYNSDNTLLEVRIAESGTGVDFTTDNAVKYKAFVWNADTMQPLTDYAEVVVE